jgi:hypothetical protein
MKTHFKPKFRVEQAVQNKSHFYDVYLEGDLVPSFRFPGVTGSLSIINKPALVGWAKNEALDHVKLALINRLNGSQNVSVLLDQHWIECVIREAKKRPEKIKDDAADLGTLAHAHFDKIIHGIEPESVPEAIQAPVKAFHEWWKNSGIELVMGDTKVASLLHGYGGSLDALGRRNGQYIILDWKTANGIYPEYGLQVAAYGQAFFETYGIYCQEGIIVRFGKKLPIDFETKIVGDMEGAFQAFLNAKKLKSALDQFRFQEAV